MILDDHEFAVSDAVSNVVPLWNISGCSELQIMQAADNLSSEPIELPNLVARELSARK